MNRAFVLMVDVGSDTDFAGFAEDLSDSLTQSGYHVLYVNPWNAEAQGVMPPVVTPPTLPTAPPPLPPPVTF